jgi:uncharacterized protein YeeX (DUF496 family)
MENVSTLDKKDLKIQALLERVSTLTAQYENQVSDLRVDVTLLSQELERLNKSAKQSKENSGIQEEA